MSFGRSADILLDRAPAEHDRTRPRCLGAGPLSRDRVDLLSHETVGTRRQPGDKGERGEVTVEPDPEDPERVRPGVHRIEILSAATEREVDRRAAGAGVGGATVAIKEREPATERHAV